MKKWISALIILAIISVSGLFQADALSFEDAFINSDLKNLRDDVDEIFNPPANNNDSIVYRVFTRSNPKVPCFVEPTPEKFDHCVFDPKNGTKILIHGFLITVNNDHSFELLKDALLKQGPYNVIYVDWSRYNGDPYPLARANTIPVGKKIAQFIKFLRKHKKIKYSSIHLIGHSLGAHTAGIVGKNSCKLGRITGLDPSGPLYEVDSKEDQLYYTDAAFVDVIHTSDEKTLGLGKYEPLGHIDFYPNGGHAQQAACDDAKGNNSESIITELESPYYVVVCNHFMSVNYFTSSINDCEYLSTKCRDYKRLPACIARGNPTNKMGFFAKPIEGPPQTKFYLKTSGKEPFC